jgi:hypothetical protein
MTQQSQPGGAPLGDQRDGADGRRSGDWSVRKSAIVGALVGGFFGLIFFAAYGVVSAGICSSMRSCPDHWAPFAIVSAIGWAVSFLVGALVALVIRGLYRVFKVT